MFGFIEKVFVILLTSIVNASTSLNYQQWMTQPTPANLHPDEYSQELLLSICS